MSEEVEKTENISKLKMQKFLANRIYQKIDYHKGNRIRIPFGNFSLLKLFGEESIVFILMIALIMSVIGALDIMALLTINKFYDKNVGELEYLY